MAALIYISLKGAPPQTANQETRVALGRSKPNRGLERLRVSNGFDWPDARRYRLHTRPAVRDHWHEHVFGRCLGSLKATPTNSNQRQPKQTVANRCKSKQAARVGGLQFNLNHYHWGQSSLKTNRRAPIANLLDRCSTDSSASNYSASRAVLNSVPNKNGAKSGAFVVLMHALARLLDFTSDPLISSVCHPLWGSLFACSCSHQLSQTQTQSKD